MVLDEIVWTAPGIGTESEKVIESDFERTGLQRTAPVGAADLRTHSQMPFAECRRAVTLTVAQRSQCQTVGLDVEWSVAGQHLSILDTRTPVIAARH
jgi:hypothetical protein